MMASSSRQVNSAIVFETVFSDPAGDKLTFLAETAALGYTVVLCYIAIENAAMSEERVAMRVTQGGHDQLPHVLVFDNSDLQRPYRLVATFEGGQCLTRAEPLPPWLDLN